MKHEPYAYTKKSGFLADAARLRRGLLFLEDRSVLNRTLEVNGKTIPNRLLAQPIEGGDALVSGAPSERTVKRYCELVSCWQNPMSLLFTVPCFPQQRESSIRLILRK